MDSRFEDADDGLGDEDPVYANCLEDEPLYENFSPSLSGPGPLSRLSGYGHFAEERLEYSDDEEHIYEHVHSVNHHPVNVFLALLQGSAPISPDPNIYEVPPGAIRSTSAAFEDGISVGSISGRNITPPSGFQVSPLAAASGSLWHPALGTLNEHATKSYLLSFDMADTALLPGGMQIRPRGGGDSDADGVSWSFGRP